MRVRVGNSRTFHKPTVLRAQSSNFNNKKLKYIRINKKKKRGNRDIFELQTAVTTFTKNVGDGGSGGSTGGERSVIDLHSQLHFGDEDYFSFYNTDSFGETYETVF